jgi:hypothetical protein
MDLLNFWQRALGREAQQHNQDLWMWPKLLNTNSLYLRAGAQLGPHHGVPENALVNPRGPAAP